MVRITFSDTKWINTLNVHKNGEIVGRVTNHLNADNYHRVTFAGHDGYILTCRDNIELTDILVDYYEYGQIF
jgi:hypothetical protein